MDFHPEISSSTLSEAVLKTVAFFDIFDFCLTPQEISDRLLGYDVRREEVCEYLLSPVGIEVLDGYVFLPGRACLVACRKEGEQYHHSLLQKVRRWKWLFACIPFIEDVYLCNRLAMAQARSRSDIDIFVVARRDRLFIVRSLVTALFHLLGLRRHGKHIAGRFCLSFFVDQTGLSLDPHLRQPCDPYFAYWALLLQRVHGNGHILPQNPWLHDYFSERVLQAHFPDSGKYMDAPSPPSFPSDILESWLSGWQLARAHKSLKSLGHPSGVTLTRHCLKFHDRDMRQEYFEKWQSKIHL